MHFTGILSIEPLRTETADKRPFPSMNQNMHFEIVTIGSDVIANIFERTQISKFEIFRFSGNKVWVLPLKGHLNFPSSVLSNSLSRDSFSFLRYFWISKKPISDVDVPGSMLNSSSSIFIDATGGGRASNWLVNDSISVFFLTSNSSIFATITVILLPKVACCFNIDFKSEFSFSKNWTRDFKKPISSEFLSIFCIAGLFENLLWKNLFNWTPERPSRVALFQTGVSHGSFQSGVMAVDSRKDPCHDFYCWEAKGFHLMLNI